MVRDLPECCWVRNVVDAPIPSLFGHVPAASLLPQAAIKDSWIHNSVIISPLVPFVHRTAFLARDFTNFTSRCVEADPGEVSQDGRPRE